MLLVLLNCILYLVDTVELLLVAYGIAFHTLLQVFRLTILYFVDAQILHLMGQ